MMMLNGLNTIQWSISFIDVGIPNLPQSKYIHMCKYIFYIYIYMFSVIFIQDPGLKS